MTQDLILRVLYENQTYDLDVNTDIPLRIDMSALENQDLGNVFGIGSQTFDLPGTKKNNRFFNHAYDPAQQDIPAFYNSIPGWIILNGETMLEGQLQLQEVITDDDGYVTYKVSVVDKIVQFKSDLANKLLKNADWSEYTHTLSSGSVVDSWNDNLLSGAVFYPVADYGRPDPDDFGEGAGSTPLVSLGTSGSAQAGYINNSTTPMKVQQFLPAIRLKDTFDVIFNQVGYTYTGSFVSGANWEQLYVLPKAQEGLGIGSVSGIANTFSAQAAISQNLGQVGGGTPEVEATASFGTENTDPGNNYNPATNIYTVPETGTYSVNATLQINNGTNPDNTDASFLVRLKKTSDPSTSIAFSNLFEFTFGGAAFGTRTVNYTGNFTAGDQLYIEVSLRDQPTTGLASDDFLIQPISSTFQVTAAPESFEDATVDMSQQWGDTKSIDLLKGVIEHFNLVFEHDPQNPNVVVIDTFLDWIRQGEIKDWTEKYETAKRIGINHTIDEQPKEILLQDQEDTDRFSKVTKEQEPNFQYGTLRILADNNLSQGEKKIGSFFGPIILGSAVQSGSVDPTDNTTQTYDLDLNSDFVFPHLYKFDNKKLKAFKFKPRIGYKVSNEINTGFYVGTGADSIDTTGSYATLSNLNAIDPVVSGSTLDLHYNTTYGSFTNGIGNINTGVSNYEVYWKDYLESLYWTDNKKVTLDLYFEPYEYKNIKLNDRILIKNQRYRINKISGFNVTKRDVVTVELIKLYPKFWQLPSSDVEPAPTSTPTPTPTPTITPTPSITPTITPTPSITPTITPTNTPTPSITPTITPTNTVTPTPSSNPTYYGPFGIAPGDGESGRSTVTLACTQIVSENVYFEFPTSPANGDTVYVNTALDDIFIGDGNWYGIDTDGDGAPNKAFQISSLGVLSNETECTT